LVDAGSSAKLWAMIESPKALVAIAAIADATPRLECLVLGPNDLAKSTGVPMRPGRAAMIPWFMTVIAAGRANGLCILDGVYNNFRDSEGFAAECAQAAEMGFDGKTLIHPAQIEAANAAFTPDEAEFERARRIVEAFDQPANVERGAISLDGEMVERLHLDSARRLLDSRSLFEK
ncbi:MAG: CoA ester lyase, partial [Alphaproteobacteria bacterium]|nr:CoA ester lyase [Alphaproteobacteria bacterium]